MELAMVCRKPSISFKAAFFEMDGRVAVATATPNTPIGNCINRNA
jgi:hypothetical protein